MWSKYSTSLTYLAASAAASFYWLIGQQEGYKTAALLLIFFIPPLLFAFAYPRFLYASSPTQTSRQRLTIVVHGLMAAISSILFVIFGSVFWKNPLREGDSDSVLLLSVPLIALPVFLVAALSLLLRNRSTLASFASFLFWPYWLFLALSFLYRFFEAPLLRSAFCFLCFSTAIFFAFAAGAISSRPATAHATAFAALVGTPWLYWTTLRDTPLGNVWTNFNVPDHDLPLYNNLGDARLTVVSVGLLVLAIATAALRLLPVRWKLRGLPVCERTWPAFGVSLIFLAIWFSQSVMPYRISGALDYAGFPILQILHVEKRGLQFHETCVNVWGYRDYPQSVSFSWNDRRLFQYRFQQKNAVGELTGPQLARIRSLIQSEATRTDRDTVKPLRKWNADGWYFYGERIGLRAYTTDNGGTPPKEIVDLFNVLTTIPRVQETQSDRKDVCLGFCYDPLSGLGSLYANHRCGYDATRQDYVCR